jgi:predicted DNA-binding transcriptional regulator YafY
VRADRLLSILLLLQVNRRMTARELAERMEVSERTILRDMDALSAAGVPVVAERGAGGGWSLLEEYQTKLTGLSPPQIQSLFLARPRRLLEDLGLQKEMEAALIKLQAALPASERRRADFARQKILIDAQGWRDPNEVASCLPVLMEALWQERQVRFIYRRMLGEAGERVVDPLGLVAKGSVWYLIALSAAPAAFTALSGSGSLNDRTERRHPVQRRGSELRTYRVSRIVEPKVLPTPSAVPPDFDLAEYWERSASEFREKLPKYHATFLVSPSVMRWVRYRGWRVEAEERERDRMRVRMRFDAEEEALQFALSFTGSIEVVEPTELLAKVREAVKVAWAGWQTRD